MNFMRVIQAELVKQHRNIFHTKMVYFTLLLWPILIFLNAYFTYKPFEKSEVPIKAMAELENGMFLFLIIGFMGYNCFWSMVQSAWQMSDERQNGTLETIFLSPANKLAIMYGRALGALLENVWMFFVFCSLLIVYYTNLTIEQLILLPFVYIILIIAAVIWGGFMNVIFLFSRDASFLFNIFDDPMILFSGVRVPISVFPFWGKLISLVFPLTHVLIIVRSIFSVDNFKDVISSFYLLVVTLILLVLLTNYLMKIAIRHSRKTGNLSFY